MPAADQDRVAALGGDRVDATTRTPSAAPQRAAAASALPAPARSPAIATAAAAPRARSGSSRGRRRARGAEVERRGAARRRPERARVAERRRAATSSRPPHRKRRSRLYATASDRVAVVEVGVVEQLGRRVHPGRVGAGDDPGRRLVRRPTAATRPAPPANARTGWARESRATSRPAAAGALEAREDAARRGTVIELRAPRVGAHARPGPDQDPQRGRAPPPASFGRSTLASTPSSASRSATLSQAPRPVAQSTRTGSRSLPARGLRERLRPRADDGRDAHRGGPVTVVPPDPVAAAHPRPRRRRLRRLDPVDEEEPVERSTVADRPGDARRSTARSRRRSGSLISASRSRKRITVSDSAGSSLGRLEHELGSVVAGHGQGRLALARFARPEAAAGGQRRRRRRAAAIAAEPRRGLIPDDLSQFAAIFVVPHRAITLSRPGPQSIRSASPPRASNAVAAAAGPDRVGASGAVDPVACVAADDLLAALRRAGATAAARRRRAASVRGCRCRESRVRRRSPPPERRPCGPVRRRSSVPPAEIVAPVAGAASNGREGVRSVAQLAR